VRRALITGAAGMLGTELLATVPAGTEAVGTDLADRPGVRAPGVDLADASAVDGLWREHGPFDAVIHCAAYTAVDLAESNAALAQRVNVDASSVVASAAREHGAHLVAISTDFVFDGASPRPYVEEDRTNPLSVYGSTKLDGERATLEMHPRGTAIVRTQWLYGPRGSHFPRTIVGHARKSGRLKVVHDQVGSPTSTLELAPAVWSIAQRGATGTFHAACEGECSWYEFTLAILASAGLAEVPVEPCGTSEFPRPARRPAYSVLDSGRLAAIRGERLAHWRTALARYLAAEPL
jgi:dTDP-4-dehydrorhamnose reductase